MLQRPWMFDNQMLVLQLWKPGMQNDDDKFKKIPMSGLMVYQLNGNQRRSDGK